MPSLSASKKRLISLPVQMLIGLVLGIGCGMLAPHLAAKLMPVGTAFVQAVKMIVVPLVFTAITLGVYQMGNNTRTLGRVSAISLVYFFVATLVSIVIGLALNAIFHPGLGADLAAAHAPAKPIAVSVDWTKFFLDMIPSNVVAAMKASFGMTLTIIRGSATPFSPASPRSICNVPPIVVALNGTQASVTAPSVSACPSHPGKGPNRRRYCR